MFHLYSFLPFGSDPQGDQIILAALETTYSHLTFYRSVSVAHQWEVIFRLAEESGGLLVY